MKKFYFVIMILALAVVFNACQKDEILPTDFDLKKGKAKIENPAPMALTLEENLFVYPESCGDVCIDLDNPFYYYVTGQSDWQYFGNQSKQISYIAYNTEEKFVILVTAGGDFNADATYTVTFEGETAVKNLQGAGNLTFEFDLPLDWEACQEVSFSIYQEGGSNPVSLSADYNLIGICEFGCEESFYYVENTDGTYTFTYIPAEDMVDALVVFTFAQGVVVSGLEDFGSSGVTMQDILNFDACQTYSWTVEMTGDCGRNLWTDFKVNGESKKGGLPNIVMDCN